MRRLLMVPLLALAPIAQACAACPPRRALAMDLVECLGDPDPQVRDGIAYEALTHWLRADAIDVDGRRVLRDRLYRLLETDDSRGFAPPFAALALAEVARTDRISAWMATQERAAMVAAAAAYLESVRDYRGFDNDHGWRHGVAHGADWLMQLTLNPALDRAQLDRILAAVATQAVPEAAHAYVFGEPERLARPVLYAAKRGLHSDAEWQAWLAGLAPRLGAASPPYADEAWLARRHDLHAFLAELSLAADQAQDPSIRRLKPVVAAALERLP